MAELSSGTKAAVVAGVTILASGLAQPASAHDGWTYTGSPYQATTLDMRGTLDPAVYHAFLDRRLDAAQAYVTALQAKVAAIPASTVLTGEARYVAKHRLAKVAVMQRLLAAIPASGPYAATPAERAQIAALQADLAALKSALLTRLANEPAVAPTAVQPALRTVRVLGTHFDSDARWTRWAGWWDGRRDGTRYDGWRYDGTRSWDGHHCDGH
jgi:hypothetical protein